jgi:hypothetical protein
VFILAGMIGARSSYGVRVLLVLLAISMAACAWVWAQSAATVALAPTAILKVDTSRPGNMFSPGAVGLSTEAREMSSGRLSGGDSSLARLMRLLGPSVLRIGGNSVDFAWWTSTGEPSPAWATSSVTPADLFALRGLLAATGWRVLLGVDLGHFEPARAADEARYAQVILGAHLLGIEIGNEPNDYGEKRVNLRPSSYGVSEYLREAGAYRQALGAAAPNVAIYGPALSETSWLSQMGAAAHMFTELTQHYYPATMCQSTGALEPTAAELLSPAARQRETQAVETLVRAGAIAGRSTRIGETGAGACGGDSAASSVFASSLWALDWVLRAASGGVKSLNFHGHLGICGSQNQSPICAPSATAAKVGALAPQPAYYGLLAASRLEGGRFVPTSLIASDPLPNLTTWATLAHDGTVRIAIENLATEGSAQPVSISVHGYTASEEPLAGPSDEARSGIALGGARVTGNGQWRPRPATLSLARGSVRVVVRPASAVIVTLRRRHSRG